MILNPRLAVGRVVGWAVDVPTHTAKWVSCAEAELN